MTLSAMQTHYLFHVLRRKAGDHLRLFNGQHGEFLGSILEISKKGCHILIEKQLKPFVISPSVTLCFAPIKRHRLELLIEKATELGVTHLQPIKTQRSMELGNLEKLQTLTIEASEQCERLTVPHLSPLIDLKTLITTWHHSLPLYWCIERAGTPLTTLLDTAQPIAFLIGPEGGFSEEEILLLQQQKFVKPVSLGPSILRAETAAIVALGCAHASIINSN